MNGWHAALVAILFALLALAPVAAANGDEGDDNDYEYGDYEYEGRFEELGEAALYGGILVTGGYVAFKHAFARARRIMRLDPRLMRYALDAHSAGGAVFGAAAVAHGLANVSQAGPIELAMAPLIAALMVSGAIMRYSLNRRARRVARLVHSQRVLALALLVLALIHASLMD